MGKRSGLLATAVALALLGFALAGAVAHGATATAAEETTSTGAPTTEPSTTTVGSPTTPVLPGRPELVLPERKITPGVFNPLVRQTTIRKTICKSGWAKKVRPPASYTNALKLKQMVQYEETGSPTEYTEDHLIPLELGGAARNPKNLWPEPRSQATRSDPLEMKLMRQVCKGVMKLAKARATIRAFKFANG